MTPAVAKYWLASSADDSRHGGRLRDCRGAGGAAARSRKRSGVGPSVTSSSAGRGAMRSTTLSRTSVSATSRPQCASPPARGNLPKKNGPAERTPAASELAGKTEPNNRRIARKTKAFNGRSDEGLESEEPRYGSSSC